MDLPSSSELYQLLDKGAGIQAAHPSTRIAPLLVCRRAHITAYRQAKTLGFLVIDTKRQFVPPSVNEARLEEVRTELGFLDLVATDEPDDLIVRRLRLVLPKVSERSAAAWSTTSQYLGRHLAGLRQATDAHTRRDLLNELRDGARAVHDIVDLGW